MPENAAMGIIKRTSRKTGQDLNGRDIKFLAQNVETSEPAKLALEFLHFIGGRAALQGRVKEQVKPCALAPGAPAILLHDVNQEPGHAVR